MFLFVYVRCKMATLLESTSLIRKRKFATMDEGPILAWDDFFDTHTGLVSSAPSKLRDEIRFASSAVGQCVFLYDRKVQSWLLIFLIHFYAYKKVSRITSPTSFTTGSSTAYNPPQNKIFWEDIPTTYFRRNANTSDGAKLSTRVCYYSVCGQVQAQLKLAKETTKYLAI